MNEPTPENLTRAARALSYQMGDGLNPSAAKLAMYESLVTQLIKIALRS